MPPFLPRPCVAKAEYIWSKTQAWVTPVISPCRLNWICSLPVIQTCGWARPCVGYAVTKRTATRAEPAHLVSVRICAPRRPIDCKLAAMESLGEPLDWPAVPELERSRQVQGGAGSDFAPKTLAKARRWAGLGRTREPPAGRTASRRPARERGKVMAEAELVPSSCQVLAAPSLWPDKICRSITNCFANQTVVKCLEGVSAR